MTDALALTEHLAGLSPITTPIQWLGGSPLLAYNLVLICLDVVVRARDARAGATLDRLRPGRLLRRVGLRVRAVSNQPARAPPALRLLVAAGHLPGAACLL